MSISPCTIASKINVTPKGAYLLISNLHSILAIANLLALNNIAKSNLLLRLNFISYKVLQLTVTAVFLTI